MCSFLFASLGQSRRAASGVAAIAWLLTAASAWAQPCATCGGGSWMFQRSYYSHQPTNPVQITPRSYGGPYYTRPQGEYISSGQRWIRSTINVPGATAEQINVVESWVQGGAQF